MDQKRAFLVLKSIFWGWLVLFVFVLVVIVTIPQTKKLKEQSPLIE